MSLDMGVTLAVLAATIAGYVLASRHAGKPADPLRPRLLPWPGIIIGLGFIAFVALVHLINLLGVTTGQQGPFQ
jgi:hypothetical protein